MVPVLPVSPEGPCSLGPLELLEYRWSLEAPDVLRGRLYLEDLLIPLLPLVPETQLDLERPEVLVVLLLLSAPSLLDLPRVR